MFKTNLYNFQKMLKNIEENGAGGPFPTPSREREKTLQQIPFELSRCRKSIFGVNTLHWPFPWNHRNVEFMHKNKKLLFDMFNRKVLCRKTFLYNKFKNNSIEIIGVSFRFGGMRNLLMKIEPLMDIFKQNLNITSFLKKSIAQKLFKIKINPIQYKRNSNFK